MADEDALKQALRTDAKPSNRRERREARAARTRAEALSPVRILARVMFLPVVVAALTLSIYIRTSPYEKTDALRHLAALAGCDTAASMGLAPAFEGGLGYHARNDPDRDGIACGAAAPSRHAGMRPLTPAMPDAPPARMPGGAKFLSP